MADALIKTLVVGPLEVNCYILWDPVTLSAFVIDPGGDAELIKDEVNEKGLTVKYVVNTHGHFDHVGGDKEVKGLFNGSELAIHEKDLPLLRRAEDQGTFFGIPARAQPEPDILLEEGMVLTAGGVSIEIIHTPGHSEGGCCLYLRKQGILFTGDTLFAGSIGRTDLPGGSFEQIINSIKTKILPLGDDIRIFPGHGPESTIAEEKEINPFVKDFTT